MPSTGLHPVTLERLYCLAAASVPNLESVVPTAAHDPPAIGTEGHTVDFLGMSGERADFLTRLRVPNLQRLVSKMG